MPRQQMPRQHIFRPLAPCLSRSVPACLLVCLALCLAACTFTPQAAIAARDDTAALAERAARTAEQLAAAAAALPPDDPQRARLEADAAAWRTRATTLASLRDHADAVLAEAADPTDPLTRGVSALSTFLPPPLGPPLVLGAALAATFLRARQLKKGAASIARSLEQAMNNDDALRTLITKHADTLRSIQTPTAKRIVDESTNNTRMLTLPI